MPTLHKVLIFLLTGLALTSPSFAATGQIIVDPAKPSWLVYQDGTPFFMCGPGDPEGFLYRGTRKADGTRNGDQMTLINKLKGTGANSIYLMAVRSHGGDAIKDPGDPKLQNPWINGQPSNGLDEDILNQWEGWFKEMDNNGIVIFFFFYDDSADPFGTSSMGSQEAKFIRDIVNRFEHHKHLIWVVAEEYSERLSKSRVSQIAAEIRAADDNDHVIAVHQRSGLTFDFPNDPNIDQFAVQYRSGSAGGFHSGIVTAWNNAAGKYNLNMAEGHPDAFGSTARRRSWAVAMGGAYVMHLRWDIAGTALSDLRDCGRLVNFMESTNFNQMSPRDDLRHGGTQYVLAKPGDSYIAYASSLSGNIGLKSMTAGTYTFKWLDIPTGTTVVKTGVKVVSGDQTWSKPIGIGNEVAVYIKSADGISPSPTPGPSNGDANGDGKVDGLDYIIWLANYSQTTGNGSSDGDFNNSGKVDGLDYVIWLKYYEG